MRTCARIPAATAGRRCIFLALTCVIPAGCGLAFDFGGYRAAGEDAGSDAAIAIDATAADALAESSAPRPSVTLTLFGQYRAWSDGTFATSCESYLHPESPTYGYEGATGNGVYAVSPPGAGTPILVLCEMTTDEGWTLVTTSNAEDRGARGGTTQTSDCVKLTSYCNVAAEPWAYRSLRHTWSSCPGGEARITKTAYQDDTNACRNQDDSLLLTPALPKPLAMKGWNRCTSECLDQTWFAGSIAGAATLVSDASFVTSMQSLIAFQPGAKCDNRMVVSYGCSAGYDNIWFR